MTLSRRRRIRKPLTNESVKDWLMIPVQIVADVCGDGRLRSFEYIPGLKTYQVTKGLDVEYSGLSLANALTIYNELNK